MLAVLIRPNITVAVIKASLVTITVLYGLLALAVGNVQGRRQGMRGILAASLGSILAWLILELFYYLFTIGSPQMRAPLMVGVALAIVGALIGAHRAADRAALRVELEEELRELEPSEEERAGLRTEKSSDTEEN